MWSVISHAMARRAEGVDSLETGAIQEANKMEVRPASAGGRCCAPVGALVALVAAGTILSLVSGATRTNAADASKDQILIGLITKTEVNPYFVKLRQAATAEAEKQGAKLLARYGKFDGDNEGQVAAIENLISAGVKGILITPNNSTGVLG